MDNVRKFRSSGMIWDDGEIPCCSYCGYDMDNVFLMYETNYSGGLVCEKDECRLEYLDSLLQDEVEEVIED